MAGIVLAVGTEPGARSDANRIRRMGALLASQTVPINWKSGIAGVLTMGVGLLVGGVISPMMGMLVGLASSFLSSVTVQGPIRVALRNTAAVGAAVWGAVVLAQLTFSVPLAAALAMAIVAFLTTVVQAVPVIGMPLGIMPGLVFFIMVTKDFGEGVDFAVVSVAALLAVLIAAVMVTLVNLPDEDRDNRRMVAAAFMPDTPFSVHGLARAALRLDSDPPLLTAILRASNIVALGRSMAQKTGSDDPRVAAAFAQAATASTTIAQTLRPRGRVEGRKLPVVDLSALDAAVTAADLCASTRNGLNGVRSGLAEAQALIEGRLQPRRPHNWSSPAGWVARALFSPDASWFRYGVQRAIALGLGVLAYKLFATGNEPGFWLLLTIYMVLQPSQLATARRAFQRGSGTFAGVALAALLSLVIPPPILLPYVAAIFLIIGIAFAAHNPAISAAFVAACVAFMVGVPASNVAEWSAWRFAATVTGCLLSLLVTSVIFRARAHPQARAARARAAISDLVDALADYSDEPAVQPLRRPLSSYHAAAFARLDDLNNDRSLLRDPSLLARYDDVSDRLRRLEDECDALVLVGVSQHDMELVQSGLDKARQDLTQVDSLIKTLPQRS